MGSPEFAVYPLKSLLQSYHEVVAVYTKAPRHAHGEKKLMKTPVQIVAEKNNIAVSTTDSFKSIKEQEKFKHFMPDVALVVAYGLILPQKILTIPSYGCINMHPSLLPRWRGPAPIQHTILAGDRETGVSIIQMNEMLDAGNLLKQKKISLTDCDNYKILHDKLSAIGSHLLLEVVDEIEELLPTKQDHDYACYAHKITDYRIYADDSCATAYRKVKAFYPKAFIKIGGKRVKILDAILETNASLNLAYGAVGNNMHLYLKGGILIPKVVQMEGRNPCNIEDFMRGYKVGLVLQRAFI